MSLMRIYTDEAAMHGDETVVDTIISRARTAGLAGGTVLKGSIGFSATSIVHGHHPFGIGDNPPIVFEIIDTRSKLEMFFGKLKDLRGIGIVSLEKVEVLSALSV
ncbi:hypothetical protein A8B75_17090 [Sphingomonadales bacterium EhC05]|nr:hypothetical protein A8B75_17090 [Sphingomonadales bacterium EhC05]